MPLEWLGITVPRASLQRHKRWHILVGLARRVRKRRLHRDSRHLHQTIYSLLIEIASREPASRKAVEVELNSLERLLIRPQKKAQILQIETEAGIRENQLLRPSGVRILVEDNHIVVSAAHTDEIITPLILLVANNLRSHDNVRGHDLSYTCRVAAAAAQFFPRVAGVKSPRPFSQQQVCSYSLKAHLVYF